MPPRNPDRIAPPRNPEHETKQLQRTIQEFETERVFLQKAAEQKSEQELADFMAEVNQELQKYMAECRAAGKVPKKDIHIQFVKKKTEISDALVAKLRQNGFGVKQRKYNDESYEITYKPFPSRQCVIMWSLR